MFGSSRTDRHTSIGRQLDRLQTLGIASFIGKETRRRNIEYHIAIGPLAYVMTLREVEAFVMGCVTTAAHYSSPPEFANFRFDANR